MHKSKCPACKSSHTVKNGKRNGTQMYKCRNCGHQFRNISSPAEEEIWNLYLRGKQTIKELSQTFDKSESTIKRRLNNVTQTWKQPPLKGGGYVHLDVTYWGHNWGVLLALDSQSGYPLYLSFIGNEKISDYEEAIRSIEERNYTIYGVIIDGKKKLFKLFSKYNIQMCQFHLKQIIRRYLTQNPRLMAARELKELVEFLPYAQEADFVKRYKEWKETWIETIERRSILKSGKTRYTHKRLRSAMHSIDFFLPYLFTYQKTACKGMPNTNNKIEGTFTSLKNKLNVHSGMTKEKRKRFICGFFLALAETHGIQNVGFP